jgi:3-methyl-2-oxobutanoate hydroxymethyltransferase
MKSILEFQKMKESGKKISMITCYDSSSARIVEASSIDCILVGDSVMMTLYGQNTTLSATPELIARHVEAVRKTAPTKFIVADMPFLAHRGSLDRTLDSVRILMQAGAQAVKIEGIEGSEDVIRHIVESGIPVVGHLGLTPQSIHQLGGFKVQGTTPDAGRLLLEQARRVEACGAFALVLECVPSGLATTVTHELSIPTIGIGAGSGCSGQVLVMQDLLGLNPDFQPKFVRQFLAGYDLLKAAFDNFDREVKAEQFPSSQESY